MRALILAALLAAGPACAHWTPAKPSTDPNPIVKIEGDTLTYIGGINAAGLTALSDAVRDLRRGQVTKMIVNSGGGDTKPHLSGERTTPAPFAKPAERRWKLEYLNGNPKAGGAVDERSAPRGDEVERP
jgi:hypothetical protein